MKQIYNVFFALCAGFGVVFFSAIFFSGCEKKIDESIISKGSDFSAEARIKAQNLDKESYKDLADLFLDTSEIDFSREVFIIFGKNQCTYCDMMKKDIKKNPALQTKIAENFNPYYINTSYQKTHKIRALGAESSTKNAESSADSAKNVDSAKNADSAKNIETQNLAQIFGVNLTPQVVFIDKSGRVKYLFAGYMPNLEKIIDDVVANPAPLGDYASVDKNLKQLREAK